MRRPSRWRRPRRLPGSACSCSTYQSRLADSGERQLPLLPVHLDRNHAVLDRPEPALEPAASLRAAPPTRCAPRCPRSARNARRSAAAGQSRATRPRAGTRARSGPRPRAPRRPTGSPARSRRARSRRRRCGRCKPAPASCDPTSSTRPRRARNRARHHRPQQAEQLVLHPASTRPGNKKWARGPFPATRSATKRPREGAFRSTIAVPEDHDRASLPGPRWLLPSPRPARMIPQAGGSAQPADSWQLGRSGPALDSREPRRTR